MITGNLLNETEEITKSIGRLAETSGKVADQINDCAPKLKNLAAQATGLGVSLENSAQKFYDNVNKAPKTYFGAAVWLSIAVFVIGKGLETAKKLWYKDKVAAALVAGFSLTIGWYCLGGAAGTRQA